MTSLPSIFQGNFLLAQKIATNQLQCDAQNQVAKDQYLRVGAGYLESAAHADGLIQGGNSSVTMPEPPAKPPFKYPDPNTGDIAERPWNDLPDFKYTRPTPVATPGGTGFFGLDLSKVGFNTNMTIDQKLDAIISALQFLYQQDVQIIALIKEGK